MAKIDFESMNPDLASERRNIQFNSSALTNLLYGGEKQAVRRRAIGDFIESHPIYADPKDTSYMSREERLQNGARKAAAMFNETTQFPAKNIDELILFRTLAMAGDMSPFELHDLAGLPYVLSQADDKQLDKWRPLMMTHSINVAYAQTELGHGSNIRRLETTATYDPSTEEFIINSPTSTSVKWWAGNLGKSANFAIVMAQLYTQGQHRGLHGFIVPLRDIDTHKPLPGILIGDIGPKFGMPGNDNGFAQFTNVRIPRENMLMRYAKVLPDGTFVPPVHQKLSYGGMVYIRAMMLSKVAYALELACTIAIRYSCVRRQGDNQLGNGNAASGNGHTECKILDYQTQQYRLFPELAKALAIHFVSQTMRKIYLNVSKELRTGDISNLARLHSLSAGLKAVVTRDAAIGVEICRLACGGHGYSSACVIPDIYTLVVSACTFEGDNIILLLQTAKALVKEVRKNNEPSPVLNTDISAKSTFSLPELVQLYEKIAAQMVQSASQLLFEKEKRGLTFDAAWNDSTVELCRAAKANVRAFIVESFVNVVNEQSDLSVQRILSLLCELYALCGIQSHAGDFMEHANMTKSQICSIRGRCCELLSAIRPAAVPLVDAFEFRDREHGSILGRYDGNVYDNLFEWARKSPLNKTEVPETFHKYILPIMREGRSKL